MINIIDVVLPMRVQTKMTTFSWKDDCTLTKNTRHWTYSALRYIFPAWCLVRFAAFFLLILNFYAHGMGLFFALANSAEAGGAPMTSHLYM